MGRKKKLFKTILTQEILKSVIRYDEYSGEFWWLRKLNRNMDLSKPAGDKSKGYVYIKVYGKLYPAHRLAFLYMTGEMPNKYVDHKDGNPFNNKWDNLREATKQENNSNVTKRSNNKSGFKGVVQTQNGKYLAYIRSFSIRYNLGTFSKIENAALAYNFSALEKHGEFCNLNKAE